MEQDDDRQWDVEEKVAQDGVNGRLVPPEDAPALAAALEEIATKSEAALRLGRAAQRLVREQYTWERVVEQFELVYDEVLGLATFAPETSEQVRS